LIESFFRGLHSFQKLIDISSIVGYDVTITNALCDCKRAERFRIRCGFSISYGLEGARDVSR
jgi:hypothetical protein